MAALSHIKNRKEAKIRENIEQVFINHKFISFDQLLSQIMHKCLTQNGEISKTSFLELLRKSHVQIDPKEQLKLEKIVNESGNIKREDFLEFAKKSSAVKEMKVRSSRSSTPVGARKEIDKAEVVFRVRLN